VLAESGPVSDRSGYRAWGDEIIRRRPSLGAGWAPLQVFGGQEFAAPALHRRESWETRLCAFKALYPLLQCTAGRFSFPSSESLGGSVAGGCVAGALRQRHEAGAAGPEQHRWAGAEADRRCPSRWPNGIYLVLTGSEILNVPG